MSVYIPHGIPTYVMYAMSWFTHLVWGDVVFFSSLLQLIFQHSDMYDICDICDGMRWVGWFTHWMWCIVVLCNSFILWRCFWWVGVGVCFFNPYLCSFLLWVIWRKMNLQCCMCLVGWVVGRGGVYFCRPQPRSLQNRVYAHTSWKNI